MPHAATIVFDLDGPVLDVRSRYWAAHRRCLKELSLPSSPVRQSAYWAAKRRRDGPEHLLGVSDSRLQRAYSILFKKFVEDDALLGLDRPQPGINKALKRLGDLAYLVLVTLRQRRPEAEQCLRRLKLWDRFQEHHILGEASPKAAVLLGLRRQQRDVVGIVGDTEIDGLAARTADVPFIAVTYGIRSDRLLAPYVPHIWVRRPDRLERSLCTVYESHYGNLQE